MVQADTRIDRLLDKLRAADLPLVVELPLCLLSGLTAGCFYGFIYFCRQSRQARQLDRLPLVTQVQSSKKPSMDAVKLEQLEAELCRDLGLFETKSVSPTAGDSSKSPPIDDKQLVDRITADPVLRQRVNQFMMSAKGDVTDRFLHRALDRLWPKLLALPLIPSVNAYAYKLSLILPAYQESNSQIATTLQRAYETCAQPDVVQVVVVNAGNCSSDLDEYLAQYTSWNTHNLKVVSVLKPNDESSGRGRGPALNYGARYAAGRVLFFLHSDTKTPHHWDQQILQQFTHDTSTNSRRVHATCFRFAFDKSGLTRTSSNTNDRRPPAYSVLLPVKCMVNLRTRFMKLPYGDQGIAIPAAYFVHIGGFPNQPIMEDYSFMDYLRMRARFLPERLAILDGSCEVSVRRWQRVGTAYMTLANAVLVYRYSCRGWSPEDVFYYYYKRPYQKAEEVTSRFNQ